MTIFTVPCSLCVNLRCFSQLINSFHFLFVKGSPFTYLVIVVWLGTTAFWLMRMNRALAMFHGLFIIPALQVFWTFFSVLGGGFFFEEFKSLEALGAMGFAVGVLVVSCKALAFGRPRPCCQSAVSSSSVQVFRN